MVHTTVASLLCKPHPIVAVLAVVEQSQRTLMMQCLLAVVVAVDRQDQLLVELLRRISPFVMQIDFAPVAVLDRNSEPVLDLQSALVVLLILLVVFLVFLHRTHQFEQLGVQPHFVLC